ncbi:MAG: sugar transferase [Magnetococcales bacterium]|nr:sugar transferase [Magnetococcales bacterium]
MKRLLDLSLSVVGLVLLSPVLLAFMYLIWRQDRHSPFYIPPRVGLNDVPFKMVKLRSMIINADKSGVDSTGSADARITRVGHMIRRYKLDEFMQLWNVLLGDMSLVGPRPNVAREVALYTTVERKLLTVKPGITDFSSIVFSDEGEILKDSKDPDLDYNQLIRPWKNRLGLFYVEHANLALDIQLIVLTVIAILSRPRALRGVSELLRSYDAPEELVRTALRDQPLVPTPPPGSDQIVQSR